MFLFCIFALMFQIIRLSLISDKDETQLSESAVLKLGLMDLETKSHSLYKTTN